MIGLWNRFTTALAGGPNQVEQPLDFRVVDDDFAIISQVDEIVWVQAIELVYINALVPVA
jgi:hypothetical protein